MARVEFEHVVDLLRQRGALDKTDATLVIRRAELCEIALKAYQESHAEPFTLSDRGNLSPHPGLKIHLQATLAIKAIDAELGLTPSSAKASPLGQASSDPLAVWRAGLSRKGG